MATVDNVARLLALGAKGSGGGGTGGTSNYPDLANKPQINGVELVGNKTSEDLGIEPGVTEEVLTQALAAEAASREKQDDLLQGEIEGKIAAANILAGENIEVSQEGNNVTISSTAEGKTYTAGTNIEITEDSVINNTIPYNPEGTSDLSVVFGDKSYSLSGETVAIGAEARIGTDSPGAIAIGRYAEAGQGSTTVGTRSALTYNNDKYCVRIGYYQDGSSHHGDILIGANARPTNDEALIKNASIAIGANAKSTQTNQAIFGSEDAPINIMQYVSSEGVKTVATTDLIPEEVPIATTEVAGKVKPDGKTITVDAEGVIKALSGGESIHVIRNNDEKPFILEDNEVGYYLLDLDTLGTTTMLPSHPKVFRYGATPNDVQIVTVRDETTFILLKYHTDIKSNQTSEEVPVLTKYDFDITQDSFPTIYMTEYTCSYKNGEYQTGFGLSQYFRFAGAVDLPKKLSELKNDTNFINQEELEGLLSNKQDKIDGTVATAENLTLERVSENAKNLTLKVNGIEIGSIPAPQVQFNGATTFVAKEVKSFYEEIGLVPETVNGFAWGSASDPAHGDINYLTEENGPYLVLTNINIENPVDLLGGNVIILKDILSTELPSPELLTIQFNGEDIGQYDGSESKTINIQAATEEYVKQLISTIQTASFEVVDSLPESDIKSNAIYLVPSNISGLNNIYDEYIYVNDKWELIGNTNIDLSQYATKEYVDDKDNDNVKYTADNNVELKNHIVTPFGSGLYGSSPENGWTNLAAVKGYNLDTEEEIIQTELGSATLHTNINSKDRPTVETSEGQEQVRYLSDTEIDDKSSSKTTTYSSNKIDSLKPVMLSVPVRTKQDKVYTQEEILAWFKVSSISDLKLLFTRDNPLFAKYGITLSTLPHYYKMSVEYAAFESANQIKLVFLGLDTSNDEPSRFTVIANLDGTIIDGNSNVQLVIEPLSKSSYNDLLDKPTINNVELKGNVTLDDLSLMDKEQVQSAINNVIDDSESSLTKTYSSSKIESLSGIKVLTGTAEKPIIVSELETGNYVLSGTVQSSESNTTTQALSKKVYTVEKGDSETVVWCENPKTHITYTYTFDTVGTNAPEEQNEIYITETQLKQAVIDGGNWA